MKKQSSSSSSDKSNKQEKRASPEESKEKKSSEAAEENKERDMSVEQNDDGKKKKEKEKEKEKKEKEKGNEKVKENSKGGKGKGKKGDDDNVRLAACVSTVASGLTSEFDDHNCSAPDIGPDAPHETKRRLIKYLLCVLPFDVSPSLEEACHSMLMLEREGQPVVDAETLTRVGRGELSSHVAVWRGDITRLQVGGIVNAANSGLLGCFQPTHVCIDNIIHGKAGPGLRRSCRAAMGRENGGRPEPVGRAKITPGFCLPAAHVLHTVGPNVSGDTLDDDHRQQLQSCYRECLLLASKNNLPSVAFCCISTGLFGFPQDEACDIALNAVREFLLKQPSTSVQLVVFNVFTEVDHRLYNERAPKVFKD